MTKIADPAPAGTALVFCGDASAVRLITESLKPLAIRAESCDKALTVSSLLNKRKFEAVIVDLKLGEEARRVMERLRLSPANRTAVTFTIAPRDGTPQSALRSNSTFVFQRPLSAASVTNTLRAAYGLVVRERRRYFRCPVQVPAVVRASMPQDLSCLTVNISEGGMAISAPADLDAGLSVAIRFNLPGCTGQLFAETKVCWRGDGGQVGLEFLSLPLQQKSELQEWLARKLDETLPESVVAMFRSAAPS